jgi:hypothetical protein
MRISDLSLLGLNVQAIILRWLLGDNSVHNLPKSTFYRYWHEVLEKTGIDLFVNPLAQRELVNRLTLGCLKLSRLY